MIDLAALLALAEACRFHIPFEGILCATGLYAVALGMRWT